MRISILLLIFLLPISADAYLDPGTGSIILQGLIAAIAAGVVVMKTYWYKIKRFFGKTDTTSLADEESTPDDLDSRPKP